MSPRVQHALEILYGLERGKSAHGLEGTRVLLEALGRPQDRFTAVHVAGTNGKGSVCAVIERVLREAGHRTGLYTSPHLVDFRERIRVSGRWADEEDLAHRLEHIVSLPEGKGRTFFEVATALAFDHFARHGVEIAVVEVGLGGRLDSTNVLLPRLAVITAIGLDHQEMLGGTLEAIAGEKAGIVKPGVPLVCGEADPRARAAIEAVARERGAPWIAPGDGMELDLPASLAGPHQRANLSLALAALAALGEQGVSIPRDAVERGVAQARWPGRFEPSAREPRLWWDGAHNPQAFARLAEAWRERHPAPPRMLVLALSSDKDVDAILDVVAGAFPSTRVIATRSRSERALDPATLAARASAHGLQAESMPDVATACRHALELSPSGWVLLAGSLFAVGEAMESFGGAPEEML